MRIHTCILQCVELESRVAVHAFVVPLMIVTAIDRESGGGL
jgi:hypothetical protein